MDDSGRSSCLSCGAPIHLGEACRENSRIAAEAGRILTWEGLAPARGFSGFTVMAGLTLIPMCWMAFVGKVLVMVAPCFILLVYFFRSAFTDEYCARRSGLMTPVQTVEYYFRRLAAGQFRKAMDAVMNHPESLHRNDLIREAMRVWLEGYVPLRITVAEVPRVTARAALAFLTLHLRKPSLILEGLLLAVFLVVVLAGVSLPDTRETMEGYVGACASVFMAVMVPLAICKFIMVFSPKRQITLQKLLVHAGGRWYLANSLFDDTPDLCLAEELRRRETTP